MALKGKIKVILAGVMGVVLSINSAASNPYIKLMLKHDSHICMNNALLMGYEFQKRNGKMVESGKYFEKKINHLKFGMSLQGAKLDYYGDALVLDNNFIQQHGFVVARYSHPRNRVEIIDTIKFPAIKRIANLNTAVNFATSQGLSLLVEFEDGSQAEVGGHNVAVFFKRYNLKAVIKDELATFNPNTGVVSVKSYEDQLYNQLEIAFIDRTAKVFSFNIPFEHHKNYNYNFNYEACLVYTQIHNEPIMSNQINVVITPLTEGLYSVKMNKGKMRYTTVINPKEAFLSVNGAGANGTDGEAGARQRALLLNGGNASSTVAGNPGTHGSNGTNGDHVTIFLPRAFTPYVSSISFVTVGGIGGKGGQGGAGSYVFSENTTLLELIFTPTGPTGLSGSFGNNGQSGIINYVYSD